MTVFFIFDINKNIVEIYNNKNIKLFHKDLIYVALESGRYINQFEKYYLVLKVAITVSKKCFSFITFLNSYLIVDIS